MGGFFSKLFGGRQLRILLLGLDSAGKTTLLRHLLASSSKGRKKGNAAGIPMQPPEPTIGHNVDSVTIGNAKLNVWDLGGQERQRILWRHYYTGTDAVIFVIDSFDAARLDEARVELHRLMYERDLQFCPFLILANKQDLRGALSKESIAAHLRINPEVNNSTLSAALSRHPINVMPIVANTGGGLEDAIEWLVKACKKQRKVARQEINYANSNNATGKQQTLSQQQQQQHRSAQIRTSQH